MKAITILPETMSQLPCTLTITTTVIILVKEEKKNCQLIFYLGLCLLTPQEEAKDLNQKICRPFTKWSLMTIISTDLRSKTTGDNKPRTSSTQLFLTEKGSWGKKKKEKKTRERSGNTSFFLDEFLGVNTTLPKGQLDLPFEEEISRRIGSRVIKGSLSKKSFNQKYG